MNKFTRTAIEQNLINEYKKTTEYEEEGEAAFVSLICLTCILITIGCLLSIYESIFGRGI